MNLNKLILITAYFKAFSYGCQDRENPLLSLAKSWEKEGWIY